MSRRTQLILAATVLAAGLALLVIAGFMTTGRQRQAVSLGLVVASDVEASRKAVPVRCESEADLDDLLTSFERSLRQACGDLSQETRLTDARVGALVSLASSRLRLLLRPDYEEYLSHVRAVRSRGVVSRGDATPGGFMEQGPWLRLAEVYRATPVDPRVVMVRPTHLKGVRLEPVSGGHTLHVHDHKRFYSRVGTTDEDILQARADLFEVWIAAEVIEQESRKPLRAYLVLSFIWTPAQPYWMPRAMGVNDPTAADTLLSPPWL